MSVGWTWSALAALVDVPAAPVPSASGTVVDSGVAEHAALDGHISSGWDMIEDDREAQDENGHGTHVAGIVLDVACDLDISVMPVRVLNGEGKGSSLTVSLGIRYAADNGADVINLSLGGLHSNYKDDSVAYALGKGVTVVVAAGNDSTDTAAFCPAHIDGCITVSAVNESLDLADFSNWGSEVDFCAPGVGVCSTVPGGYAYLNGTSMAAPHISGLAALLLVDAGVVICVLPGVCWVVVCPLDSPSSRRRCFYRFRHGRHTAPNYQSHEPAAEFSFPGYELDIRRFTHDVERIDRRGHAGYFDKTK